MASADRKFDFRSILGVAKSRTAKAGLQNARFYTIGNCFLSDWKCEIDSSILLEIVFFRIGNVKSIVLYYWKLFSFGLEM